MRGIYMASDDTNELSDEEEPSIDPKRLARIEKEKKELLASLAGLRHEVA
jgi:hypothetical protein